MGQAKSISKRTELINLATGVAGATRMERLVIIGGGISGLSCAFHAREVARQGGLPLSVTVLEAQAVPGGKMQSDLVDGLVIEQGPNGFLDSKPWPYELSKALAIESSILRSRDAARRRFVCRDGALLPLPETPRAFLSSRLLSAKGKLRLLLEPFAPPPPPEEETVAQFCRRRLGQEALDYLIDPMVSGVFAGDPERLSISAAFPRIVEIERQYGGLFRGMFALMRQRRARPRSYGGPGGTLVSFEGGVRTFIEAIASALGEALCLSAPATAIRQTATGFEVRALVQGKERRFPADAVVLACEAYEAARLLSPLVPEAQRPLSEIPYAPVAVVATAFLKRDIPRPVDGFGFLLPQKEGRKALGTLWDSAIFEGRAPQGRVLLRTIVGGACAPELAMMPDDALLASVLAELKDLMGVEAAPYLARIYRYEKGIPQYEAGHKRRVALAEAALARMPGLFLCNNAYRGIAFADCCREAEATARAVCAFLAQGRQASNLPGHQ